MCVVILLFAGLLAYMDRMVCLTCWGLELDLFRFEVFVYLICFTGFELGFDGCLLQVCVWVFI